MLTPGYAKKYQVRVTKCAIWRTGAKLPAGENLYIKCLPTAGWLKLLILISSGVIGQIRDQTAWKLIKFMCLVTITPVVMRDPHLTGVLYCRTVIGFGGGVHLVKNFSSKWLCRNMTKSFTCRKLKNHVRLCVASTSLLSGRLPHGYSRHFVST